MSKIMECPPKNYVILYLLSIVLFDAKVKGMCGRAVCHIPLAYWRAKKRKKSTAGKGRRSAKPACKKGGGSEGEGEKPRRRRKVKCKAGVQKRGSVVKERKKSPAGE